MKRIEREDDLAGADNFRGLKLVPKVTASCAGKSIRIELSDDLFLPRATVDELKILRSSEPTSISGSSPPTVSKTGSEQIQKHVALAAITGIVIGFFLGRR